MNDSTLARDAGRLPSLDADRALRPEASLDRESGRSASPPSPPSELPELPLLRELAADPGRSSVLDEGRLEELERWVLALLLELLLDRLRELFLELLLSLPPPLLRFDPVESLLREDGLDESPLRPLVLETLRE